MEYEHGDAKVKSQQEAMFATAEAGDTIITLEVPRLARSTQQLCEIIDRVREKRLRLVIIGSITLDCRQGTADPMSEAFLQILDIVACVAHSVRGIAARIFTPCRPAYRLLSKSRRNADRSYLLGLHRSGMQGNPVLCRTRFALCSRKSFCSFALWCNPWKKNCPEHFAPRFCFPDPQ